MAETIARLMHWRLHLVVLVLACLAEVIGIIQIDIAIGTVVLLPLLYAFFFSLLFNPNIVSGLGNVVGKQGAGIAPRWILICMMPFMAKFAIGIGPQIGDIIAAGPALILQELGNVATLLIAMPVAVLLFNMGRETIGATHSIAREPNIALVADRYGLKSSEGIGVMGVYVMGTVFGGVYFSLVAGLFASWELFDIRSLAMACGVGSGSMMGACSTALAETVPDAANEISAFAATSNLLTYGTGLFVSAFIALPLAERLFTVLAKVRRQKASASNFSAYTDEEWESGQEGDTELPIRTVLAALVWVLRAGAGSELGKFRGEPAGCRAGHGDPLRLLHWRAADYEVRAHRCTQRGVDFRGGDPGCAAVFAMVGSIHCRDGSAEYAGSAHPGVNVFRVGDLAHGSLDLQKIRCADWRDRPAGVHRNLRGFRRDCERVVVRSKLHGCC